MKKKLPYVFPKPYWEVLKLDQMNRQQWEDLCDHCGRCCLNKLRDEDTNVVEYTEVACSLLDIHTGQCSDYCHRAIRVPDCIQLTPALLNEIDWLPRTCAYRLIHEGKSLPFWHPLVSGTMKTVYQQNISVKNRIIRESEAGDLENHVVYWRCLEI
ncbi:hypothetical protein COMNV_00101 [Commensalibacter sp. Nvir]|uniref:YcgN family cysteine cluster protein n=1 Tax=Commensalibacter sp. Nvir TaxID=3069817 RepID=UPI002D4A59D2|nr:hypothetical protein COMNV_00101 [Commensalibacter sp. Nvir]